MRRAFSFTSWCNSDSQQVMTDVNHTKLRCAVVILFFLALTTPPLPCHATLNCGGCHGKRDVNDLRPIDAPTRSVIDGGLKGNHLTHTPADATAVSCEKCHPGSTGYTSAHRTGVIRLASNINGSPVAATYGKGTFFNQTSMPVMQSCANVNCHFEAATPAWGNPRFSYPADCVKCHGAYPSGGASGAAGSHAKHDTYYTGIGQCRKCHPDHAAETDKFAHAASAGSRNLLVQLHGPTDVPGGTYTGPLDDYLPSQTNTFGACNNLYCHSQGTSATVFSPNVQPAWGTALPTDCTGCHGGDSSSPRKITTGSHGRHISTTIDPIVGSTYGAMDCNTCHSSTVSSSRTIASLANHVNLQIDVVPNPANGYANYSASGHAPGAPYGSCTVYCHSNVQNPATGLGAPTIYTRPLWGHNTTASQCGKCHGGDGTIYHGGTLISTGSHTKHLLFNYGITEYQAYTQKCTICHKWKDEPFTTTNNCKGCHGTSKHVDHKVDVLFDPVFGNVTSYKGTPQPGDGFASCRNTYCHSSGTSAYGGAVPANSSPAWGISGPLACNSCHGNPPLYANGSPKANTHDRHTAYTCNICHSGTTTDGTTITSIDRHVNKAYDVIQGGSAVFTYSYIASQGGSCTNVSCHAANRKNLMWSGGSLPPASPVPADKSAEVPVSQVLSVVFAEAMDPATINATTFIVSNGVSGTVNYNTSTKTATFTPSAPLAYYTTYTVTITTGVKNLAGIPVNSNFTWDFTTAKQSQYQVYLLEKFESGALPTGWSVPSSSYQWVLNNPQQRVNFTGGTGKFAIADSDATSYFAGAMNTELRTPLLNLSSCGTVELEFKSDFLAHLDEVAVVEVSSNGSSGPWTSVWQKSGASYRGPRRELMDISGPAAGKSSVMIRFRYSNATYAWWWQIDDVIVRGW